jgi:diguanylate cyclase (GGDEF)-like protein/PAS domain S-box-containing protein
MFKLLRYFSITSLIAMLVAAVLLGAFYRHLAIKDLIRSAERNNLALTQAFSNSLWPQFAPFMVQAAKLSGDELRAHPETARLMRAVATQVEGLPVLKVKTFDLQAKTLFSTEAKQIGEIKDLNYPGSIAGRTGEVISKLSHRDVFTAIGGVVKDRDVLSSYLPIRRGPGEPIEAVFEIYSDVTALLREIERTQRAVIVGVLIILALLYAMLFLIIRHADKLIQRQYAERKQAEQALRESEARFRDLIEGSIAGILIHRDWKPLFVNQAYVDILGYDSPEEILAMESRESQVAPHERARIRRYGEARRKGEEAPSHYEYDAVRKDGSIVILHNVVRSITWEGRPATQNVLIDITKRKRAEEVLRRYEHIVNASSDLMSFIDTNYIYQAVNASYFRAFGKNEEEIIGHSVAELAGEEAFKTTVKPNVDRCFAGEHVNYQYWLDFPQWGRRYLDVHFYPFREAGDSVSGAVGNARDITEAHHLSEELSYQASHDTLTGLINRREFEQRLQRALQIARVEKTEHALCYLDLDELKIINDTCGHVAGDALLRQLGGLLQEHVRKRDTLARLGGDEFGVLLEHCSVEQAMRVVNALHKAVGDFRFLWGDKSFNIGVSIGLVPVTEASESITAVLSAADTACYAAKDAGRNRIHVYREGDAELARRHGEMQWVPRIDQALEQDRFHLAFQPIAALKGSEGEHYELLIRLEDEEGHIVAPGAFLPAAERYNLSTKIDRWVIGTAFEWLSTRPEHVARLFLCAINLSGSSLGDEEFLQFVIRRFDQAKIPPHRICFEITETAAITNLTTATRFIKALKALGCRFALDDFGSGLSSFAYLKNLPVDFLKIDGMFVKEIADDPIALAMVSCINQIGHVMGKQTIAEFVENEAILEKLREIGVDYAQGYGISRPQPLADMQSPRPAKTVV